MKSIFWLIPDRLAGRSGPTYEPWSLSELRAGGFDAVLNLSEFEPDYSEFARVRLEVAWVPLPDTWPADPDTEEACLNALPEAYRFLMSQLDAGRTVLVHCAWGRDRTGLLLAHHLVCSSGLRPAEAIAAVRRLRPKALTAPGWEPMAERIITTLSAKAVR